MSPPRDCRLLFVIDNDYGALGSVLYLLRGQALASDALLLLPPAAHALHGGLLPVASQPYVGAQDILAAARRHDAAVVCLFSGYLMAFQKLLSTAELREVIQTLRAEGRGVATSDPYLGTFLDLGDAKIAGRVGPLERMFTTGALRGVPGAGAVARLARRREEKLWRAHLRDVSAALCDSVHIYPGPATAREAPVRSASFFNPSFLRGEEPRTGAATPPTWLFVLASFDAEYQDRVHGAAEFSRQVASKIQETLDNGRRATFIGPPRLRDELARRFGGNPAVTLVPPCSFEEFDRHLLGAEIAFYWQIFSTSGFMRLWRGMPVFFFDRGHNAHILKSLHEAGLARYYVAGEPHYLDIKNPLDERALAAWRPRFEEEARASRAVLEQLASPDEMIRELVAYSSRTIRPTDGTRLASSTNTM